MEGKHAIINPASVLLLKDLALAYEGNLLSGAGPEYSSWVSYALSLPGYMDFWLEYLASAKPCHFPQLAREIQPVPGCLNLVGVSLGHPSPPRKLCSLNGLTITNLLQIAWGVVLRYHTGSDDVCSRTLVTGREARLQKVHDIVCSIFNVLACRLTLSKEHVLMRVPAKESRADGKLVIEPVLLTARGDAAADHCSTHISR